MMKKLSVLTIFCLAILATTANAQNLLSDPGFALATPDSQTSNSAWVLDVNTPDGVGTAAQFQDATWASNPGSNTIGVWLKAFEGMQATGDPPAHARLSQTVGSGSMVIGSVMIDLNTVAPFDASWNAYSLMGTAPAGTTGVRVVAEMVDGVVAAANPQSAMFDDFLLTQSGSDYTLRAFFKAEANYTSANTNLGIEFLSVPEPSSLVGLIGTMLSLLAFRRK